MAGLLDEIKKSQYLQMAEQKLQGLLNIPTEAQRFLTNPQAFMSLLGRNDLPKETGFAAGATGLPSQDILPGGVLNPPNLAYQQGYEQGEPFSYAAMAAPMALPVGKALAPKAYDALENYMVKTGGMIPLEAWHGTPHNIQGKFDINKVGTGEGAQAYGHGMYFAESPTVANSYRNLDPAGGSLPPVRRVLDGQELQPGTPEYHAGTLLSRNGVTLKDARSMVKSWIDDPGAMSAGENTVEGWKKTLDTLNSVSKKSSFKELPHEGNLYKVDIPDEYVPTMMDWDKPLSKQPNVIERLKTIDPKELDKLGINPDFTRRSTGKELTGESLYDVLTTYNSQKGASNFLAQQGITGIRYLDQGSRGTTGGELIDIFKTSDGWKSKIKVANRGGAGFQEPTDVFTTSMPFKSKEEAKAWADEKINGGSSNFVVFDPSTVNILEKNSQKVEGLLD